jgi:outer membrane immunogenic protein
MKNRLALALVALCLTPAGSRAAELAVSPLYRPAPFVPRQTVEWTGLYLGVNAGYGWGPTSTATSFQGDPGAGSQFARLNPTTGIPIPGVFNTTPQGLGATELSQTSLGGSGKLSGAIAGGQIGFNWQAGWAVFGAEFDAQWSGQRGSFGTSTTSQAFIVPTLQGPTTVQTCSKVGCVASDAVKIKSLLTGRARFGVAFDWIMPYVTAGAALASVSDDLILTIGGVTGAFNTDSGSSKLGWTAGAGVDVALTSNWSARFEYLYVSLEDIASTNGRIPNVLGVGFTNKGIDVRDNIVRVGLNYRFGPRGGPGVIERPLSAPAGYASAYDFLPSITTYADSPIFASKANGAKPAPSATMVAGGAPQREAPVAAGRAPERAPAAATVVAGEVPQREAPIAAGRATERAPAAAAREPKGATPAISRFADIEDTDGSTSLAAVPAAITLPTLEKRPKADDDSRRLNRIMTICSGC